MTRAIPLTPEIEQHIMANYDTLTSQQMATELGVSLSTVYRFYVRLGVPDRTHARRIELSWTDDQTETFKKLYPVTEDRTLADIYCVHRDSVRNIARRLGIEKDADYIKAVQSGHQRAATEASRRLTSADIDARNKKISATKKEDFRKDRMRYYWDLPTRLRPKYGHNHNASDARHILRRRGYICPVGGKDIYRVVGITRVLPSIEESYAKKYHFTFDDIII